MYLVIKKFESFDAEFCFLFIKWKSS